HAPPPPQPAPLGPGVQGTSDRTGQVGEERLGQASPRLAVGAGLGGARALPPGQPVGDQAGDGGATGVVGAEGLPQEDPERDQRGEDPVEPAADRGQRGRDNVLGEDVGEGEVAVLQELAPEKANVFADRSGVRIPHRGASLPEMEWLPTSIYASEAHFAYVISEERLTEDLRAIRVSDRRTQGCSLHWPIGRLKPSPGRCRS